MANPVWVLSVNMETKTAAFTTGLADAAKGARGAFTDIKGGAGEMGRATNYSMMEARHSVMMLGEEFGIRVPRALSSFIAGLGPIGPALEAAFPFLAIAGLATIVIERLIKMREAGEKLTEDQVKFGAAVNTAWNTLDKQILQAQIRADELRKDHIGALQLQIQLLDKESLENLVHSFEEVAKAADVVLKDLEGHWYTFGKGSEGAEAALKHFHTEYDSLLARGKSEEASGLLKGTLAQAQQVQDLLRHRVVNPTDGLGDSSTTYEQAVKAHQELDRLGISTGANLTKQLEAQQNLVTALNAQVESERRIADLKKLQIDNASTGTHQTINNEAAEAAKKAQQDQERLEREFNANFRSIEDERIQITQSGSAARLSAIRAAIADAATLYGLDSEQYRHYLVEEAKTLDDQRRQMDVTGEQWLDQWSREQSEAAREDADNAEKMGLIGVAALKQRLELEASTKRNGWRDQINIAVQVSEEEYRIRLDAIRKEEAALDKYGADYANKLKQLQDKEKQLTAQHENDITTIKEKAEIDRNQRSIAALSQFEDATARGLAQSILGHQTWSRMLISLTDQVAGAALESRIREMMSLDFGKEKEAAAAARKFFLAGAKLPFPVNLVAAPVLAAGAFAAVMAFEGGTDRVPGVGRGDVVPTMLTPGEGVVPGGVMDGLRNMARNGSFDQGGGPRNVVHVHMTNHVNTIDGDGWDKALEKHADQTQRHFENALRRMNR